ncbi:mitochondrial large subunit ribosomal [Cystoisospora suis]|uniref:Large ribosomal subunit protein mL49 n=1 Tax=Cystoisospora suis TaxID=483139 RepID=A0A2C6L405_9APIC|nr:mitochondrial large subunit ribosomal [Cystoisospora suis]
MFSSFLRPGWEAVVARREDLVSGARKSIRLGVQRLAPPKSVKLSPCYSARRSPCVCRLLSPPPPAHISVSGAVSFSVVKSTSSLRDGCRVPAFSLSLLPPFPRSSDRILGDSLAATRGPQSTPPGCTSLWLGERNSSPSCPRPPAGPSLGAQSFHSLHRKFLPPSTLYLQSLFSAVAEHTDSLSPSISSSVTLYPISRVASSALWHSPCFGSTNAHSFLCATEQRRSLVEVKFTQQKGKDTSQVPFKVVRTPSGNLPVYARVRKHGTAVTTIIRHAFGDITAMKKDLMAICEAPVRERCGTLEVKGLHVLKVKQWLRSLGF